MTTKIGNTIVANGIVIERDGNTFHATVTRESEIISTVVFAFVITDGEESLMAMNLTLCEGESLKDAFDDVKSAITDAGADAVVFIGTLPRLVEMAHDALLVELEME